MVSFETLRLEGDSPIYQQVIRHVKRGIVAGSIRDGDEMPSRRVLSALLGVNPNTIQKACRILEEEGLLESRAGAKSFLSVEEGAVASIRRELLEGELRTTVAAMKEMGLSREEGLALIGRLWDGSEEELP